MDVDLHDDELIKALRSGDEEVFVTLVGRYHSSMLRLARSFVSSAAVAEEVVQDTWLAVLRGVSRFEGRSSFKTWMFRILVNRARTTGARENRSVPMGEPGPAVDASRFDESGCWVSPPERWVDEADDRIDAAALGNHIRAALEDLPERQRQVVILRDVEGLRSEEVCTLLRISQGNQRVLLHRGRSRLREALAPEFGVS